MAVIDSTNIVETKYLLSQTPPDFVEENYFLKELQQKIDVDWRFRPNRVNIEEETGVGTESFVPIQVVIQTVKNDKGETVSDDWRRVVFRDCQNRKRIGQRYRFSYDFAQTTDDMDKNIWIGMNQNTTQATSDQVICRCNGTLGSVYVDESGESHYHYEPVIQTNSLQSPLFNFSEIAIDPRGSLVIIAQHNQYTQQYFINQRFVVGENTVYKINNILRTNSLTTYKPSDVGIIKIYMEYDQSSEQDDFSTRIAYNGVEQEPKPIAVEDNYSLEFVEPVAFPENLTELTVHPALLKNGVQQATPVVVTWSLTGPYSTVALLNNFVKIQQDPDDPNIYILTKIKRSLTLQLQMDCTAVIDNGKTLSLSASFGLI